MIQYAGLVYCPVNPSCPVQGDDNEEKGDENNNDDNKHDDDDIVGH